MLEQCADADSLQLWLQRHGANLKQLRVSAASGMLTQLPCPKLTHLLLQGDSLLAARALPLVLAGLPSLQHLSFSQSKDMLSGARVVPGLLQHLPLGITHLELAARLSSAALQGLSRLTKCSHLVLEADYDWAVGLSRLQELQRLTLLRLSGCGGDTLYCSSLPDFSRFTAMQHLYINHLWTSTGPSGPRGELQPTQFAGLTGLQHLHLGTVNFYGGAAGGAELLAVLPKLSSLTNLVLLNINDLEDCPAEAFAAITSSSRLQHLVLGKLRLPGHQETQCHIWQHIFPANKQLLQLTTLVLQYVTPCMSSLHMQACVSCCPKLQLLDISGALEDGVLPVHCCSCQT